MNAANRYDSTNQLIRDCRSRCSIDDSCFIRVSPVLRFLETHVSSGSGGRREKKSRGRYERGNVQDKIAMFNELLNTNRDETSIETDISEIDKTMRREKERERDKL